MINIGVDLGGTNISVGVVDKNHKIISRCSCKTKVPRKGVEISKDIFKLINESLKNINLTLNDIPLIGVGCPGTVNKITGIVEYSSNLFLHKWQIVKELQMISNKRVVIENDANAAAYGEYLAGSARGYKNSITITLGTGVGGGIIIDGKIYNSTNFAGAEIGHMVIDYNGRKCTCSRNGCFETYASATGIIKTTKDFMEKYDKNKTILWSLSDYDINKVNGRTPFQAAKRNDRVGKMVVNLYISQLACGITNIINVFQPDILCIGGGVSKEDSNFLLYPLQKIVDQEHYSKHSKVQTKIVKAKLGNNAGIIGISKL